MIERSADHAAPNWSRHDSTLLAQLPASLAIAMTTDERIWRNLVHRIAERKIRRNGAGIERQRRRLRLVLGARLDDAAIDAALLASLEHYRVRQLQIIRCMNPRAAPPPSRIDGVDHVIAAQRAGRGAILWVAPFHFATIMTKAACHAAGLPVHHLSHWRHGPFKSTLGARLLNRPLRYAENRFLAERIVIEPGAAAVAASRKLARRLGENRIVSITVGDQGTNPLEAPFLSGRLKVAIGAIKLAAKLGCPLLPVHTLRGADGLYTCHIDPPLPVVSKTPRPTVEALAATLAERALAAPDQFWWGARVILPPAEPASPEDAGRIATATGTASA